MGEQFRSLRITAHRQNGDHVEYDIVVEDGERKWTVSRRYNEFVELDSELRAIGPVPVDLPAKRGLFGAFSKPDLHDRQLGLERYLRALLGHRDSVLRTSRAFTDFLNAPAPQHSSGRSLFTSSSWLDEYDALLAIARTIRADIGRRDALARSDDAAGSHQAGVDAKKKLATLLGRLGALATGLDELGRTGMAEGELRRRSDMVIRLQDETEALSRLAIAAKSAPDIRRRQDAPSAARADLLGQSGAPKPVKTGRALGKAAAPVETDVTRALDNVGLLQLQQDQIDEQDSRVSSLAAVVRRQRELGACGFRARLTCQASLSAESSQRRTSFSMASTPMSTARGAN